MSILTLTTDFGTTDPFVGVIKGVILSHAPHAQIVDLTHGIGPQDIITARCVIDDVRSYFPAGTVHMVVVDPGVGTERLPLIVEAEGQWFVGPDNGLFGFALGTAKASFWSIRSSEELPHVSATFHGRDVFAPVAAKLASGVSVAKLGIVVPTIRDLPMPRPIRDGQRVCGEIVGIDRFGNLITNVRRDDVTGSGVVYFGAKRVGPMRHTYGEVERGEPLALMNSFGRLEIAVRDGSAAVRFDAQRGAVVTWQSEES